MRAAGSPSQSPAVTALPKGEVDLRSKDGEGEAVYLFKTTVWFQLFS